jgi:hypothetical protein
MARSQALGRGNNHRTLSIYVANPMRQPENKAKQGTGDILIIAKMGSLWTKGIFNVSFWTAALAH